MDSLQNPQTAVTIDVTADSDGVRRDRKSAVPGDVTRRSSSSSSGGGRDCGEEERRRPSEAEIIKERRSSASECSVELDLERGIDGTKLHLAKPERDCRICHMSLHQGSQDSGVPIELGCSCKDDLAAAHKNCAETWFKIKGNKICEVCGSLANNVSGASEGEMNDQWSEVSEAAPQGASAAASRVPDTRNFWQGHRFLNFLLACMVFAFVISWLFHFNVPS